MQANIKIDKKKIYALSKYSLTNCMIQFLVSIIVCLANIIIAVIIVNTSDIEVGGGNVDMCIMANVLIAGIVYSSLSIKFALINGASRNTVFISETVSGLLISLIWSLLAFGLSYLGFNVGKTYEIYGSIYGNNIGGMWLFYFLGCNALYALGRLISLIYYKTSKLARFIILGTLALIFPIGILINHWVNGSFFNALGEFFMTIFGVTASGTNPFIASLSFSIMFLIFTGAVYLLIRKVTIREK